MECVKVLLTYVMDVKDVSSVGKSNLCSWCRVYVTGKESTCGFLPFIKDKAPVKKRATLSKWAIIRILLQVKQNYTARVYYKNTGLRKLFS